MLGERNCLSFEMSPRWTVVRATARPPLRTKHYLLAKPTEMSRLQLTRSKNTTTCLRSLPYDHATGGRDPVGQLSQASLLPDTVVRVQIQDAKTKHLATAVSVTQETAEVNNVEEQYSGKSVFVLHITIIFKKEVKTFLFST